LTAAGATHAGNTGVAQWYANFVAPAAGDQMPLIQALQLNAQIDHVDSTTAASASALAGPYDSGPDPVINDRRPAFSGTAAPGSTVRLYIGPASSPSKIGLSAWTKADATGHWTLTTRPLRDGRYRAVAMSFSRALRTRPGLTIMPTAPLGSFAVAS